MKKLWATANNPTSAADYAGAAAAGAQGIVFIPNPAYPNFVPGLNDLAEPGDPPSDLAGAKTFQLVALAAIRWTKSQAFIYTMNGQPVPLPCDTDAATNVLGAIVGLQLANSAGPIEWKVAQGVFASLSLSDLIAVGQAMRAHVQACFVNEAQIGSAIAAISTDAADVYAIDLTQGWPQ